ncbi:tyrosine-type recombinase/integrase, partial [Pseudomonas aeruginosa]|nr:tyrosine-type recombinase/integrase [Pseudomonas aeruginosa]
AGAEPLGRFTFHGLRHTGLTRLGQSGATEAELMAFAGHSDPKAVRIYQHAERNRLAALADRMTGDDT